MSELNPRESQLCIPHRTCWGKKKIANGCYLQNKKGQGRNKTDHAHSSGNKGDFHFHLCKHEGWQAILSNSCFIYTALEEKVVSGLVSTLFHQKTQRQALFFKSDFSAHAHRVQNTADLGTNFIPNPLQMNQKNFCGSFTAFKGTSFNEAS